MIPKVKSAPEQIPPKAAALAPVAIELQGVRKTYRLGEVDVVALRSIDLRIRQSDFAALVGASGAGKSTLMNIIGCMDAPSGGRVVIGGVDVSTLSGRAAADLRNRCIGFVFQAFNLIPVLSVYENVELPLLARRETPSGRRAKVLKALDDVGLQGLGRNRPDQLSGGQRQRVAIARALITEPVIVIADEPTANLDSANAHQIIDLMAALNDQNGVTFLFSTHDERLIGRVKRVIRIVDGATSEDL